MALQTTDDEHILNKEQSQHIPYVLIGPSSPTRSLNHHHTEKYVQGCPLSKHSLDTLSASGSSSYHIPRDPIQPQSGSISDVHSETSVEDEEVDFFSDQSSFRPRSNTCPENRSEQRKVKVRGYRRPLTPPAVDADKIDVIKSASRMAVREKYHIPTTKLSDCIPESPKDKEPNVNVSVLR